MIPRVLDAGINVGESFRIGDATMPVGKQGTKTLARRIAVLYVAPAPTRA